MHRRLRSKAASTENRPCRREALHSTKRKPVTADPAAVPGRCGRCLGPDGRQMASPDPESPAARLALLLQSRQEGSDARKRGVSHGANPYMDSPIFKLPFQTVVEELQLDLVEAWWDGWAAAAADDRLSRPDRPGHRQRAVHDRSTSPRRPAVQPTQEVAAGMEKTSPSPSRWTQDGVEYVRSNEEWLARCAAAMVGRRPAMSLDQAFAAAAEFSLDDRLRALSPERAAESFLAP